MKKFLLTVFFLMVMLCSLVIVSSAEEAYLEEIPENLLFENDTVTHFIVFDDEKYYKGSGNTINFLNTEEIEKSLTDLGITDGIGTKYLTKFVFPDYMGENLVTNVNVNADRTNGIKVNKYFRNVCGYVVFPSAMTVTHDMNECTSELRGIDFGENSQLIEIPYCFAPNSKKMKEVKNFPTENLQAIKGSAFNNNKYAFNGVLVINAKTVDASAFNNALTYVTDMVFGENVESLGSQSFSVRASETGLGAPLLESIEFKCDITKLKSVSYGPFYFYLGGDSRSEYPSLNCIILSNDANKDLITDGVTTIRDIIPDTYVRFFYDTTLEVVYTSHKTSMDGAIISYDSFLENGTLTGFCERCGKGEATIVEPLFTFKGISVPTNGDIEIYIGYSANYEAISQYEEVTGNKVNFGIVAAAKSLLGDNLPLDFEGNATVLEQGAVIKAPVSNGYAYESYEFIIRGFTTEAQKDAMLLMASYVHITDKDGITVSVDYLQSKQVVDNDFIYISYNSYEN